ncbi:MAG: hypothetical protein ACKO3C_05875, partial [Betaproteobacteria bacterium]
MTPRPPAQGLRQRRSSQLPLSLVAALAIGGHAVHAQAPSNLPAPPTARTSVSSDAYPIEQLVELADRHNIAVLEANEALRAAQAQIAVASVL